jgi:hypothetical protein
VALSNEAYEKADAVADRLCFVELVERLARLRRYLRREAEVGERPQRDIVQVFLSGVEGILKNLDSYAALLSLDKPLDEIERTSFARWMTTHFSLFREIHALLSNLRGSWGRPESQLFVENVRSLLPSNRLPEGIPVVLQNEYSFEQNDLATGLNSLLMNDGIVLDTSDERPTVFLPKAEHDNPLYWANLVHECGHIDRTGIDELTGDLGGFVGECSEAELQMLMSWGEELYCDLFAAKVLGPAYLVSFLAFTFLEADLSVGDYGTESHPPDVVRICLMQRVLENRGLRIPLNGDHAEFQDIATLYYLANERRVRALKRQYHHDGAGGFVRSCHPPEHYKGISQAVLNRFVDRIIEKVDETVHGHGELQPQEFQRIDKLAERLKDGILIGSCPDEGVLLDKLGTWEEVLSNSMADNGTLVNASQTKEAFDALAPAIQENPTTPWEIINAGWLHKVQIIQGEAFQLFFREDGTLLEKMDAFDARLQATDDVLLKSIEVAQIHRVFQRREQ